MESDIDFFFFFCFPCLINWEQLFKGPATDQADIQAVFYQVLLYTLCLFSQIQKHALDNQTLPQLSLTVGLCFRSVRSADRGGVGGRETEDQ